MPNQYTHTLPRVIHGHNTLVLTILLVYKTHCTIPAHNASEAQILPTELAPQRPVSLLAEIRCHHAVITTCKVLNDRNSSWKYETCWSYQTRYTTTHLADTERHQINILGTTSPRRHPFPLQAVEAIHPKTSDAELSRYSAHSLRVWACVLLDETGMTPEFIMARLRWMGTPFECTCVTQESSRTSIATSYGRHPSIPGDRRPNRRFIGEHSQHGRIVYCRRR